jgi:hypothetical protein
MGVGGQHHAPAALPPGKRPGTHRIDIPFHRLFLLYPLNELVAFIILLSDAARLVCSRILVLFECDNLE